MWVLETASDDSLSNRKQTSEFSKIQEVSRLNQIFEYNMKNPRGNTDGKLKESAIHEFLQMIRSLPIAIQIVLHISDKTATT